MATPGVFPSRAQSAPLLTIRVHPEKSIQTQFEDALFKGRHSEAERLLVPLALGAEPPSFADIASRKMDQKKKLTPSDFCLNMVLTSMVRIMKAEPLFIM